MRGAKYILHMASYLGSGVSNRDSRCCWNLKTRDNLSLDTGIGNQSGKSKIRYNAGKRLVFSDIKQNIFYENY